MRLSTKLELVDFGKQLIETGDLDPVYILLCEANFPRQHLAKWLLSYWCFYSVSTASIITDSKDYWQLMQEAAATKNYQRGTERRHFRGQQSVKAMSELVGYGKSPYNLIHGLHKNQLLTSLELMNNVKKWRGFGNWIAFKVADMLETLGIARVVFKPDDVFNMFDSPVEGAQIAIEKYSIAGGPIGVYNYLTKHLKHLKAPPLYNRSLGIQEVETVLCKWKSHLGGHYPVAKDTKEIHEALIGCSTPTAKKLLQAGSGKLW